MKLSFCTFEPFLKKFNSLVFSFLKSLIKKNKLIKNTIQIIIREAISKNCSPYLLIFIVIAFPSLKNASIVLYVTNNKQLNPIRNPGTIKSLSRIN